MVSDALLLQRYARHRDAEAFAELVRRHSGLVYGTCLRIVGNAADAEDLTQDCFLEMARKAGQVSSSLPGWLHALARSRAIDLTRRSAARARYEALAMPDTPADEPTWAEIAPHVDAALAAMDEELREPLIRHFLQGRTQAEVARELGCNQSTVSRRLERGLEALRARLREAGVLVTVAALAAVLTEHAAVAAPAGVLSGLMQIGMAGVGGAAAGGTLTAWAGKLMLLAVGIALLAAGIVYVATRPVGQAPPVTAAVLPLARPQPTTPSEPAPNAPPPVSPMRSAAPPTEEVSMTTPTTTAGVPPTGQRIVLTTVPGFANTDEGLSHMAALAAWLRSQGEAVDQDWLMGGSGEAFAVYYHPDGTFLTPFVHTWDVADAALGLYGYRSAWESGSLADIADELRAGRPVIAPGIRPSANGVNSRCHYWFVVSGADLEKGTVVLQGAGDAPLETWPPRGDGPPEGKHPCWHGILRTFAWGKPQHYGPDGDCPVLRISEAGPVPDRAAVVRQALARAVALHREGTTVKAKRYGGGAYLSGRTALQRLHDDLLAAPGDGLDDFRARYHTKDDPFGGLDSETCHLGLYAQRREAAARFLAQAAPLLPEAARPYLATAAEHCTKAAAEARAVHTLRCGSEEEQRAMAALVAEDAIADNAQWDAYWEKCDTALASAANRRTMAEHVARMIAHEDEAVAALQEALSRPTAMVAGVARLRWGRDNTFINALTVAATAMGDDVTYADLMGASGAAFRVQIHRPDWCPSAPDAALGFSCVAQAVQACGYTVEQIVARDDASKATLRAAVVASIDQGWPVVAIDPQGSGDYGIIAGYTQGGARFLWRTYADKDDAYGEGEKWPLTAYVIRERGPAPARAALAKAALARAGEMLRAKETSAHILRTEEEQAKYLVGAAAYQAWVNRLCSDAQCTQPDERARKHAMHANAWMYLSLLDARAAAADYLRGIAPDLPEAGRAHVLAAADVYGRIAEALRAGRNNAPHDWQHPVTAWTRERREAQADLLRRIAAQERLAVFHLDRALAALDGREAGAVLLEDAARIYHEVGVEVAGIHQPRSEVISRMVALRAAGLPADYATLVTLEGYGTSFAYHPRKFSAMYQPITHAPWEPDARTEAATGLQWRGTGKAASADDAFRIVKAEVDAGRPVGGQWLDDLLFLGYRDAARPDDRQVYVAGGWDEPGWWSWTRFSEWAAKWGLVRNLGPTPTIPVRDTAMAVMRDMVAWTTRDPRPSTEPTYGLASMAALAGDLADPAKTAAFWSADMRGCHGINRQVFGRSCAAAYLRGVAPEFPADARAHIRAAADHYADAWAAWQAWARELGYLSGGMDAADLERTWGDMARRTKGAALVRTAAEHERLAAEALARALALLG